MCGLCAGHVCEGDGDSLSDDVLIVVCLDLEGTVVGPKIDRVADTSNSTFVDLGADVSPMP